MASVVRQSAVLAGFVMIFIVSFEARAEDLSAKEIFEKRCAVCHGEKSGKMTTPILFGQVPEYLENTLLEFKSGKRKHKIRIMDQIANTLSEKEIKAMAKYLAYRSPCEIEVEKEKPEDFEKRFERGKRLAERVNCSACHDKASYPTPHLYGQKYQYLKSTLIKLKNGERTSYSGREMNHVARTLNLEEIKNLATYFSGIRSEICN